MDNIILFVFYSTQLEKSYDNRTGMIWKLIVPIIVECHINRAGKYIL